MAMDFRNSSLSTFTLLLLFTLYSPFSPCLNRKDEGNEVFCMCSSLEQEFLLFRVRVSSSKSSKKTTLIIIMIMTMMMVLHNIEASVKTEGYKKSFLYSTTNTPRLDGLK